MENLSLEPSVDKQNSLLKLSNSPLKMKNAIKKLQDAGFMASPTSLNPTGFRTDCRIDEILKLLS